MSLLKAWQVTVVWIECHDGIFYRHFKKVHTRNCSLEKNNSASKVANWITSRYSLLTLCYHWQTLSISFLLEMAIAEDH